MKTRKRQSLKTRGLEYQLLEPRKLLSGSELFESDPTELGRTQHPFVVSGDPGGTPSATPSSIIDPNVSQSAFAGVVSINPVGNGFSAVCSGTLISPRHVLSAAHCFDSNDNGVLDANPAQSRVFFNLSASPFAADIESIELHPNFTGFNSPSVNDDLAIVTLSAPAPSGVPVYSLNQQTFNSPERIIIAGFGRSGTGVDGFTTGASFTTRRVGQNVASSFFLDDEGTSRREVFLFDFDGPTNGSNSLGDGLTLGNDIEVTIGGGDSGGPSFLWNDGNGNNRIDQGELRLFGVNTFGSSLANAPAPFFGSQAGGIVVSSYLDFIEGTIESSEPAQTQTQVIGQSGTIVVSPTFRQVNFGRTYANPVVIAGPLSREGGDPATVRIRNVTATGFQIRLEEFDYLDGNHLSETVSFAVFEAGRHELQDGTIVQAGNVNGINHQSTRIDFSVPFSARPVLLTQVTTQNGASTVVSRLQGVNRNGFTTRLQEQESADNIHAGERIGFVAIERGRGTVNGITFDAQLTGTNVTHQTRAIDFRGQFPNTPAFFANIQTFEGSDPVGLRYRSLNADRARIFAQEEQSADSEIQHTGERVGYLAIERGLIRGRTFISSLNEAAPPADPIAMLGSVQDFATAFAAVPLSPPQQAPHYSATTDFLRQNSRLNPDSNALALAGSSSTLQGSESTISDANASRDRAFSEIGMHSENDALLPVIDVAVGVGIDA